MEKKIQLNLKLLLFIGFNKNNITFSILLSNELWLIQWTQKNIMYFIGQQHKYEQLND